MENASIVSPTHLPQPLSHAKLVELTLERGDDALVELYNNHSLEYTPNGGSHDLRTEIAKLYDSTDITADHILVTTGAQVALQTAALAFGLDSHSIVFVPGYQSTVEFLTTHETNITCIPRTASTTVASGYPASERCHSRGYQIYPFQ